jgi:DNA polymerase III delta subunit
VSSMIRTLELTEDPYMVFGLLSGQAFQLAALAVSDKPSSEVAKDIGAHPFAVSKLSSHAKRQSKTDVREIIAAFADADDAMKSSGGEPWLLIERTLIKVANI